MRGKTKAVITNFSGGLVTDTSPLNSVSNTTMEEDNCDLDRKGFRKRRLGFTYETGYSFNASPVNQDDADLFYIKTHKWSAVNNDPTIRFLVIQFGNVLYFYDRASDPLSDGQKDFTVDLDDFAAPGISSTASKGVQVASGKGVLFVVGELIEPFYITYDLATDDITTTELTIRIRDFELQDHTTSFESRPSSLTDALKYDLYNQGWGYNKVTGNDSVSPGATVARDQIAIDFYLASTGFYPPRTKPWWIGNRTPVDPGEAGFNKIFDPSGVYDPTYAGNTLAPVGHFVLDAFRKDRAAAAGFGSFTIEDTQSRPTAVAFLAGHVFFGHKNLVYFSQLITDDTDVAGNCYQEADPTAEDINELVATDGGVILIPTSGEALKFETKENSLIAFYDNGIWAIGGSSPGDGFSATGHSVSQITREGALSSRTIFSVEGDLTFWGENGIFSIGSAESVSGSFKIASLTDGKIQDFYDDIGPLAKEFATGAYDKVKKRIVWLFSSNPDLDSASNRFYYDRVLNFDLTKQAFFPYTISELSVNQPSFIVDVFNKHVSSIISTSEVVTDGGVTVTDGGVDVTVNIATFGNTAEDTDVKYLVTGPTTVQVPLSSGLTCPTVGENNVPVTAGNSGEVTGFAGDLNGEFSSPQRIVCNDPLLTTFSCSMSLANIADRLTEGDYAFYMPYLRSSDHDFAIPSAATIIGIQVRIGFAAVNGGTNLPVDQFRLAWGASASTLSAENKASECLPITPANTTNATYIVGGLGEMWGETSATLTPTVINSTDFGMVFKVSRADINPGGAPTYGGTLNMGFNVTDVNINVFYSL